jgi:hypothetical protein
MELHEIGTIRYELSVEQPIEKNRFTFNKPKMILRVNFPVNRTLNFVCENVLFGEFSGNVFNQFIAMTKEVLQRVV